MGTKKKTLRETPPNYDDIAAFVAGTLGKEYIQLTVPELLKNNTAVNFHTEFNSDSKSVVVSNLDQSPNMASILVLQGSGTEYKSLFYCLFPIDTPAAVYESVFDFIVKTFGL